MPTVNQTMTERFFAGKDPIGQHMDHLLQDLDSFESVEIVGIAPDRLDQRGNKRDDHIIPSPIPTKPIAPACASWSSFKRFSCFLAQLFDLWRQRWRSHLKKRRCLRCCIDALRQGIEQLMQMFTCCICRVITTANQRQPRRSSSGPEMVRRTACPIHLFYRDFFGT